MNIREKILGLSGSYTFYKSEYEKLLQEKKMLKDDNDRLLRENESLRVERENFLSTILSGQDKLAENVKAISGTCGEINDVVRVYGREVDTLDGLIEENEKVIDAVLSAQEAVSTKLNRNYDMLVSVEEVGLRVEKSSAYTNIKLDSKFDEGHRLISENFDGLEKKVDALLDEE